MLKQMVITATPEFEKVKFASRLSKRIELYVVMKYGNKDTWHAQQDGPERLYTQ
jgi:hypothetical protein